MDLYPWLCALYIEEKFRGNGYGHLLIEQAKRDTKAGGFNNMYLCTDLLDYYEKYGFKFLSTGHHPWDEESRIYQISI